MIAICVLGATSQAQAMVLAVPLLGAILPMLHRLVETAANNALSLPMSWLEGALPGQLQAGGLLPSFPGAIDFRHPQSVATFEGMFPASPEALLSASTPQHRQEALLHHQATLAQAVETVQQAQASQRALSSALLRTASMARHVSGQLQALQVNGEVGLIQARLLQQVQQTLLAQTAAFTTHAAFEAHQQALQAVVFSESLEPEVSGRSSLVARPLSPVLPRFSVQGLSSRHWS